MFSDCKASGSYHAGETKEARHTKNVGMLEGTRPGRGNANDVSASVRRK